MSKVRWGTAYLLVLCVVWCAPVQAQSLKPDPAFSRSVELYRNGDYSAAVQALEGMLTTGAVSSAIFYNLGNSYYRKGEIGQALLNYRRALEIAPRDPDIRANLDMARSRVAPPDFEPLKDMNERYLVFFERFSLPELRWGLLFVFICFSTGWLTGWLSGAGLRRLVILMVSGGLVVLMLLSGVVLRMRYVNSSGVILATTPARFEPSEKGEVHFNLPEGREVRILAYRPGWFRIERSDARQGWVSEDQVGRVQIRGL